MPRDVTILCLLDEIRHLKQIIEQTPELHYVGFCQWRSTRPLVRRGLYTSHPPAPDEEVYTEELYYYNG
jgi:hypothetical protein